MRTLLFAVLPAVAVLACGSSNNKCVTGQSSACTCTDGHSGAQVCGADGTFGACTCNSGGGAGGGSGGGTGGGAGGGSGGGSGGGEKRVFVTSGTFAPTTSNGVCQNVADAHSLGGTWKPWLSGTATYGSAIDNITGTGPWKLLDGTVAFANHGALAVGPAVPIQVTELGTTLPSSGDVSVWTGTQNGGTVVTTSFQCGGYWNDDTSLYSATVGDATSAANWTQAGTRSCNEVHHVYCFEQ